MAICTITTIPANGTIFNGQVGVAFSQNIIFDFLNSGLSPSFITTIFNLPPAPGLNYVPASVPGPYGSALPPINTFGNVSTTISGVPTLAGTYNIGFEMAGNDTPPIPGPFTCNVSFTIIITAAPSKRKRGGIWSPETFCCDPKSFKDGICPPKVMHKGFEYISIGNGCYVLRRK